MQLYVSEGRGAYARRDTPSASASLLQKFSYLVRSLFGLEGGRCWKLSVAETADLMAGMPDAAGCGVQLQGPTARAVAPAEPDPVQADPAHAPRPLPEVLAEPPAPPVELAEPPGEHDGSSTVPARPMQPDDGPGPASSKADQPMPEVQKRCRRNFPQQQRDNAARLPVMAPTMEGMAVAIAVPQAPMAALPRDSGPLPSKRLRGCSPVALSDVVDTLSSIARKGKRAVSSLGPFGDAVPPEAAEVPPVPEQPVPEQPVPEQPVPVDIRRSRRPRRKAHEAALPAVGETQSDDQVAAGFAARIRDLQQCRPAERMTARVVLLKQMVQWLSIPRERPARDLLRQVGGILGEGLLPQEDEDEGVLAFSLRDLPALAKEAAPELALALALHLPRLPQESRVALMASLWEMLVRTAPSVAQTIRTLLGAYSAASVQTFAEIINGVSSLPAGYRPLVLAAMAESLRHWPAFDRPAAALTVLQACVSLPPDGEGSLEAEGATSPAALVERFVDMLPVLHGPGRDTALIDRMLALGDSLQPKPRAAAFRVALFDALTARAEESELSPPAGTAPG